MGNSRKVDDMQQTRTLRLHGMRLRSVGHQDARGIL